MGGGVVRNTQTVRGLADRGWKVVVLTTTRVSPHWSDASPLVTLPSDVTVVRARTLDLGHVARRLGIGRGIPVDEARAYSASPSARPNFLREFVLAWVLVPDPDVLWVPFAIRAGRRLLRENPDAHLMTAGPPHSSHLVGLALSGRTNGRWLVDTQDPWADHPFPVNPSPFRRRIERVLEAMVLSRADHVASATDSQTVALRTAYPLRIDRFVTLPNGFDESAFAGVEASVPPRKRILHVGSFYGPRSPATFLEALRRVVVQRPALSHQLEVFLTGYVDPNNERSLVDALADPLLRGIVRYEPFVPRLKAIALMLGAGALLLVTDPLGGGRDLIPLKTYEYLRAGRPILALVPEGETAKLLRRAGGARIAHPRDASEIARAIADVIEGAVDPPDPEVVASLDYSRTVDRIAALLEGDATIVC